MTQGIFLYTMEYSVYILNAWLLHTAATDQTSVAEEDEQERAF